jgi:hypothetical protein
LFALNRQVIEWKVDRDDGMEKDEMELHTPFFFRLIIAATKHASEQITGDLFP